MVLVGPTGVGKTSMARAFSEIINKDKKDLFIMFCFNIETQVSDLYGTLTLEQGIPKSVKGPLYKAFEEGNIFIADEFNLAEDSILQSVSIVLESSDIGSNILIPGLGSIATYNPNFFFIACQNDVQTKGRRLLPEIISKRLIMFEYPEPKESDIEASCRDIATYELLKDCDNELKESFPIKISRFMFLLNQKREPEIGEWSMRNIRKLYRRIKLHKIKSESKEFINITYIHQIVFYILQSINPNKRSEILVIILDLIKQSFNISDEEKEEIKECIESTPQLKKSDNSLYLIKGKNGIKISKIIENKLNGFDELKTFLDSLFYCLFCDINEHLLFLGPSSYKTFLSRLLLPNNSSVINLYNETSLTQLLGSITLTNSKNAKYYYLSKILEICHQKDDIKELSKNIEYIPIKITNEEELEKEMEEEMKKINEYENKVSEENDDEIDNNKYNEKEKKRRRIIKNKAKNMKNNNIEKKIDKNENEIKFLEFKSKIKSIIDKTKNKLKNSISIHYVLDNLEKKLFEEIVKNSDNLFGDFTAIFKEGILPNKILLQQSLICKNISNLKPQVLERFNDLINFDPKIILNEDYCNTFTGKMKEWSDFNENFKIFATSQLENFSNLSEAIKSRFSIIQTSKYSKEEQYNVSQIYYKDTPYKLYTFINEYKKNVTKKELNFSNIIKIISLYKNIIKKNNEETQEVIKEKELAICIYRILFPLMKTKKKKEKLIN